MANKRIDQLRAASTLADFARLIGFEPSKLAYLVYQLPDDHKYRHFNIAKKNGGTRQIFSPQPKIKLAQTRLAKLLSECLAEIGEPVGVSREFVTRGQTARAISHGFRPGLSIASNALQHTSKRYVLNLDLQDFFPSIHFGRVRGYFLKNKYFLLHPKVATVVAGLACHRNFLPQGSPSSPIISNLVGRVLDIRLTQLARANRCTYTRYVDDITFSTVCKCFPSAIAVESPAAEGRWTVGVRLRDCIEQSGFRVNDAKTRMYKKVSRQVVTGLVVNESVNVSADYYRNLRSMCHSLFNSGSYFRPSPRLSSRIERSVTRDVSELEGMLSYVYAIKSYRNRFAREGFRHARHDGTKTGKNKSLYPPLNRLPRYSDESHIVATDGIKNLYEKFLFYKWFYACDSPLLISEGDTDNVYLKCALRNRYARFPKLVTRRSGSLELSVKFFSRSRNSLEMLKLAPGAGGMEYLAESYMRRIARYGAPVNQYPVIMIVDDDDSGRRLITKCNGVYRDSKIFVKDTGALFLNSNLYVFKLPSRASEGDTQIEDYFEPEVLNVELDGKRFNRSNKRSSMSEFGKTVFANEVVRKRQASIDFSNFDEIFEVVNSILDDWNARKSISKVPSSS